MKNRKDKPLNLTPSERTGMIVLLIILFFIMLAWRLIPQFVKPDENNKAYQIAWKTFQEAHLKDTLSISKKEYASTFRSTNSSKQNRNIRLFRFDPNTTSKNELINLGLPERTAITLIHYRNKGGKFYKKEDLKKLYTLTEEEYNRIAPYIVISGSSTAKNITNKKTEQYTTQTNYPKAPEVIYLNKTNAETLQLLPGIGPVYAKRIITYRNVLGGFISVNQLQEIYGFPDSTFQKLKNHFKVNPKLIRKINVNTATEAALARHPYISNLIAKNIIMLRNDLNKFTSVQQLKLVPLINEEKYRKIAPYLSI